MKKFLIIISLLLTCFIPNFVYSDGTCSVDPDSDSFEIGTTLNGCLSGTTLVSGNSGDLSLTINNWAKNLAILFGILAVGAVVYGAILMIVSVGEEEKIKKAKDVIKWGLIGFLGIVSASTIIVLIVNIMYSLEVN